MIPWDFGLINAFKNRLDYKILPSEQGSEKPPYIVFNFEKYHQRDMFSIQADFSMKIADVCEWSNLRFEISKKINRITHDPLDLYQGTMKIGCAQVKIFSLESKQNNLILKMTAKIYLRSIYEDEEMENAC